MRKLTNKLKEITPLLLWNFYRSLYYGIIEIIQNIGPSVRTRCYCGIKLYYNKNNAIIKRLKKEML